MIIPAILMVGFLVASLSIFTGSAYAQITQNKSGKQAIDIPALNNNYPDSIQQWRHFIEASAQDSGIDPNLIAAVMLQESGGQAEVMSSSGAVGLMQVMPKDGTAAAFICEHGPCFSNRPTIEKLMNPEFNIDYGAKMLSGLIKKKGSIIEALYQYGPMDVGYYYAETVLAIYQRYQ